MFQPTRVSWPITHDPEENSVEDVLSPHNALYCTIRFDDERHLVGAEVVQS